MTILTFRFIVGGNYSTQSVERWIVPSNLAPNEDSTYRSGAGNTTHVESTKVPKTWFTN